MAKRFALLVAAVAFVVARAKTLAHHGHRSRSGVDWPASLGDTRHVNFDEFLKNEMNKKK